MSPETPIFDRMSKTLSENCESERNQLMGYAQERHERLMKMCTEAKNAYGWMEWGFDRINGKLPSNLAKLEEEESEAMRFIHNIGSMPCSKVRYWNKVLQIEQTPLSSTNALELFQQRFQTELEYLMNWIQADYSDPILVVAVELPSVLQNMTQTLQQQFIKIEDASGSRSMLPAYNKISAQVKSTIQTLRNGAGDSGNALSAEDLERQSALDSMMPFVINVIEQSLFAFLTGLEQMMIERGVQESAHIAQIPFDQEAVLRSLLIEKISDASQRELRDHPEVSTDQTKLLEYGQRWQREMSEVDSASGQDLLKYLQRYGMNAQTLPENAYLYYAIKKVVSERCAAIDKQTQGANGNALIQADVEKYKALKGERQQLIQSVWNISMNDRKGLEQAARQLGLNPDDYPA